MIKSFTFSYSLSFPKFHYKIQGRPVLIHEHNILCHRYSMILFYYTLSHTHAVFFWRRYTIHKHTHTHTHTHFIIPRIHNALLRRAGLSIIVSQFYCSTVPPNKRTFLQRGKEYKYAHTITGKRKRNTKIPTPGFLVNLRPILYLYIYTCAMHVRGRY